MREQRGRSWTGLWASMSEGRPPCAAEVEHFAAHIWRDAYRRGAAIGWEEVEVGSPSHRRSVALARAALGAQPGG